MSSPPHSKSTPRNHALSRRPPDWPDSPVARPQGESTIILPDTPEPSDPSLDEYNGDQFPKYICIPPPAWDDQPARHNATSRVVPAEQAMLIPIDNSLLRDQETAPDSIDDVLPGSSEEEDGLTYIIRGEAEPKSKRVVSSVLLLMLAVFLLFVFAYITQK